MSKVITNNVTIFIIRSQRNNIKGDCVFLNEQQAKNMKEEYDYQGYNVYIDSLIIPFVGKYVSYIDLYKGFDYGFSDMYDVCYKSQLYPSVELAKTDKCWLNIIKAVNEKPEEFNIYQNKICSKDIFGDDWFYGDVMEGKFCAEIRKLKVIR